MRMILQSENQKERRLYVPNILLLNRLASFLIARGMKERGIHLSYEQIRLIAKRINDARKRHPDWVLLEAEQSNGERIKIIV